MQKQVIGLNSHKQIDGILRECNSKKFLLVCDSSFKFLSLKNYFDNLDFGYEIFDKFSSNPLYEDVCNGVDIFKSSGCDAIVAVGGGSALDVAKCIKLFSGMDGTRNYLEQEIVPSKCPLIAIPTTAGTGSESTRFAVIYYQGKKQSIAHECIIPDYAVLDHSVLATLPVYQKKCTMLDALCQGIESWWSVNSTDESKQYAKRAVELILNNYKQYIFEGSEAAAEKIMLGANYSGRAINISQTTAPHAMSYKLTSLYGIPHGHAVAVCLPKVWAFMADNAEQCWDKRGAEYLFGIFKQIANALGENDIKSAITRFEQLLSELQIAPPTSRSDDLPILATSVNPTRLGNNPIKLKESDLLELYKQILKVS